MQVAATLRYARISPQKCRLVADIIRGKSVDEALRTLTFHAEERARASSRRCSSRRLPTPSTTTVRTSTN